MAFYDIHDYDYTELAWDSLYEVVDSSHFLDNDASLIYDFLIHKLKLCSFGDYLKRYLYQKAALRQPFAEVSLKEYQTILQSAFSDNHTPASFMPTTAKLSALSKNWLTQNTVKRNVVFLLGFGLNMSVEDVNTFLTKGIREQEINPKNPFEVICWYCYTNHFNYLKYQQLWERYQDLHAIGCHFFAGSGNDTMVLKHAMDTIQDDASLIHYLKSLKANQDFSLMSATARRQFQSLYEETRTLIAKIYNTAEEKDQEQAIREYQYKLSLNDRLSDFEKQERIRRLSGSKKVFRKEDISESDIERIICSAIPTDRHGNLSPIKASQLNSQFSGKRFSRQHVHEIISNHSEVSRFDLITLNFFVYSQKLDLYPDPKIRYARFQDSMNHILDTCFLDKLYVQNPYECFILMCILSNDPLGTYADVWELSYNNS